jgi:hypothetical protein
MPDTWQQLVNDPHVHLGINGTNTNFRIFVEDALPEALAEITGVTCTIETLMEAQYICVDVLAQHSPKRKGALGNLRLSLSEYENADVFLWIAGMSEKDYCCGRCGMSAAEFALMAAGKLLIRDLLEQHPAVILAPILSELKTWH